MSGTLVAAAPLELLAAGAVGLAGVLAPAAGAGAGGGFPADGAATATKIL